MSLLARLAARAAPVQARCVPRAASALRCMRPAAPAAPVAWLHCSSALRASQPTPAAAAPAEPIKYTTHLAGLDVVPNGREVLMGLLKETLASIEAYNKEHGFEPSYNTSVRTLSEHRLRICEEEQTHAGIEKRLWFGQIEELIEQAEDELDLLVAMNEEVKPWVPDPAFHAEVDSMQSPNFGETHEEMVRATRNEGLPANKEEEAAEAAFWSDIDAEIEQDKRREAEQRAQRQSKQ